MILSPRRAAILRRWSKCCPSPIWPCVIWAATVSPENSHGGWSDGQDPGGMKLGNHRPSYHDLRRQFDLHLLKFQHVSTTMTYLIEINPTVKSFTGFLVQLKLSFKFSRMVHNT